MNIFGTFSLLTILIGCRGLFGLAAFTAGRRRKEIGVRKAMGANSRQIIFLLSKDFMKLVVIGVSIAIPIVWIGMNKWLEAFVYRTDIDFGLFVVTAVVAVFVAVATVSYQAFKAASVAPVDSLRQS